MLPYHGAGRDNSRRLQGASWKLKDGRHTDPAWSIVGCIHQLRTVPAGGGGGTVDVTAAPNRGVGGSGFSGAPGIASSLSRTMCRAAVADLSRVGGGGPGGRLNILVHPAAVRLTHSPTGVDRHYGILW